MTAGQEPIHTMQRTDLALYPAAIGKHESRPVYGHLIGNQWVAGARSALPVSAPLMALEEVSTTKTVVNYYGEENAR